MKQGSNVPEEYGGRKKVLVDPPHHLSIVRMCWRGHVWLPLDELTTKKSIRVNSEMIPQQ